MSDGDGDDWVKLALNDDVLVVQLILKLKRELSSLPPPPPQQRQLTRGSPPALNVEWTVRQRRSRQVSSKKGKAAHGDASTRASPTTPLSWSGATTSGSGGGVGGGDGFEESSFPAKAVDTARSKVAATSETPSTKRSRKKKTLPELKEEESLLSKERKILKNQLASLRHTVENQRSANERLKRLKVDLVSRPTPLAAAKTDEVNSNKQKQIEIPCEPSSSIVQVNAVCNKAEASASATFQKQDNGDRDSSFVLPDLNLPLDDDSGSDVLYGSS